MDPHPGPFPRGQLPLHDEGEDPSPEEARAVEQYLMLTIDHGFNASTFTARVITSTGADLGSAVLGAIGALSGPLHGGAPSRALDMIDEIGSNENADSGCGAIESGTRLMGFGHRVYKTDDPVGPAARALPRSSRREGRAGEVRREAGGRDPSGAQARTKPVSQRRVLRRDRMDLIGMPPEIFTPTFCCSRVIGWTSHILEQAADNRLIRPSANYTGATTPAEVPEIG